MNTVKDLPKVNSVVECVFPGYEEKIKCKILSRAGKSTTANWHFLNIQEDENDRGKCCDFKDVKWRDIHNEELDDQPTVTETFYGDCDPIFDSAKQDEIQKWKLFKTFNEVPNNGQKAISTRWVCTRKMKGNKMVCKARLVARGFEENSKALQTDSPTCSKESLRIVLAIISSYEWKLHSLDIKSAFLQGAPMDRNVFIKPPEEAKTTMLWNMVRCPYGLADAGRHWYMRLRKELIEAGMIISKYDQALFRWYLDGKLCGLLVCHVDDILFGGQEQFHDKVINKIRRIFAVGLEENTNLKYLGLTITQSEYGIKVSTSHYAKSLKSIPVSATSEEGFSSEQTKTLKQFCGQINWLTSQGRPDIAFNSCYIANSLKTGNSNVFHFANKTIRKIQQQEVNLNFPSAIDFQTCKVVSFCDASHANLPNAGSQGGFVSFIVDQNGLYCPITWQSRKLRRVVKSTIAAECLAAVEACEMSTYLAFVLKEILRPTRCIETVVYCDNKNLVNAVHSTTNLEDKRLLIDMSILRDMLLQRELSGFLWVSTDYQLANPLTKLGASCKLFVNVLNNLNLRFCKHTASFK